MNIIFDGDRQMRNRDINFWARMISVTEQSANNQVPKHYPLPRTKKEEQLYDIAEYLMFRDNNKSKLVA